MLRFLTMSRPTKRAEVHARARFACVREARPFMCGAALLKNVRSWSVFASIVETISTYGLRLMSAVRHFRLSPKMPRADRRAKCPLNGHFARSAIGVEKRNSSD